MTSLTNRIVIVALVTLSLFSVLYVGVRAQAASASKWRYTVLSLHKGFEQTVVQKQLNDEYGMLGWELTAAVPAPDGSVLLFLKQPR